MKVDPLNIEKIDEFSIVTPEAIKSLAAPPNAQARSVQFSLELNEIHPVAHRKEMEPADVRETWYDRNEILKMRTDIVYILKKMKKSGKVESDEETMRGLECRTNHGSHQRKINRLLSLSVVIEEQDRQSVTGETNADAIAEAYSKVSKQSQVEAYKLGLNDEAAIKKDLEKYLRDQRKSAAPSRRMFGVLSRRLSMRSLASIAA